MISIFIQCCFWNPGAAFPLVRNLLQAERSNWKRRKKTSNQKWTLWTLPPMKFCWVKSFEACGWRSNTFSNRPTPFFIPSKRGRCLLGFVASTFCAATRPARNAVLRASSAKPFVPHKPSPLKQSPAKMEVVVPRAMISIWRNVSHRTRF